MTLVFLLATALEAGGQESPPLSFSTFPISLYREESAIRLAPVGKRPDYFSSLATTTDEKTDEKKEYLALSPKSEKKDRGDWIDKWNTAARWTSRGTMLMDFLTTWRFLATPDYRAGKTYLQGNPASASEARLLYDLLRAQNYPDPNGFTVRFRDFSFHHLPAAFPDPPSEGNLWKHFGGARSKPGVLISATVGGIVFDIFCDRGYQYFSKKKGRWRHLRILFPIARSYVAAKGVQYTVGGVKLRSDYLNWVDWAELPRNGLPTAEEWFEKHP